MLIDKVKLEQRLWQLYHYFELDDTIEDGEWGYDALLSKLHHNKDHWKKSETLEEWFKESINQLEGHIKKLQGWLQTLKILLKELKEGKFELR